MKLADLDDRAPAHTASVWTLDIERVPGIYFQWGSKHSRYSPETMMIAPPRMICWAAKRLGGETIYASEFHHGREKMLDTLWELCERADIIIGFNSRRFDVPHINGELRDAGYVEPMPFKQIDLYQAAKRRFKYDYNSMKSLAKRWGLSELKQDTGGFDLWKRCLDGNQDAWDTMKRYNMQDVRVTEAMYLDMRGWIPSHPNMGLWSAEDRACAVCAGTEFEKAGTTSAVSNAYAAYRCTNCSAPLRSNHRRAGVSMRPVAR